MGTIGVVDLGESHSWKLMTVSKDLIRNRIWLYFSHPAPYQSTNPLQRKIRDFKV